MTQTDEIERIIAATAQDGRNMALDAAIEVCADCARGGEDAATVLRMLRDLKEMLNQKMDA